MKNKITGWLIDLKNGKSCTVEFEDSLENLYQLCNCETIDITVRKIGRFEYDITCDDEGLLMENPIPTAFDSQRNPMLYGNLLLTNHDDEGSLTSLKEEQIADLKKHLGTYVLDDGESVTSTPCINDCEYSDF